MRARPLVDGEARLLLRAALLPGEQALAAFADWRARHDLATIPEALNRLLPLIHANLDALGFRDPVLPRLKGVRRFHWSKNQILLSGGRSALATLETAGIPAMVLKGAGMIASWYRDQSLRPLSDFDVLVPTKDARAAVECLARAGWRPGGTRVATLCGTHLARVPSWGFAQGGHALDLHWHMLHQAGQADADAAFWAVPASASLANRTVRVPCPEDQLLHAFAHGMQSRTADRFLWPADAAWIIRGTGGNLDWTRVVDHAVRLRLVVQLRACLFFLADELDLPVPAPVLGRLRAERSSMLERGEFALRRANPRPPDAAGSALLAFQDFRRRTGDLIRRSALEAVGPYLQDRWRLDADAPGTIGYAIGAALGRPAWLHPLWLRRPRRRLLATLAPDFSELALSSPLDDDTLVYGWSEPERYGRWTDGPEAVVALRPQPDQGRGLTLRACVDPFLVDRHPAIRVTVWANDRQVAEWPFHERIPEQERRALIPAPVLRPSEPLVLTFVIRRPCRPRDIGQSADTRRLGLYFRSLTISPLEVKTPAMTSAARANDGPGRSGFILGADR